MELKIIFKKKIIVVSIISIVILTCLFSSEKFNLFTIRHISSKGRVQDKIYNPELPVIDLMIKMGKNCIPVLIRMIQDERELKKGVIDFWEKVTVGDLSLIILTDFFTNSSFKEFTIPEASWNNLLEVENRKRLNAEQKLRKFINKYCRKELEKKWWKIWISNKDKIYWDSTEKCFKVQK